MENNTDLCLGTLPNVVAGLHCFLPCLFLDHQQTVLGSATAALGRKVSSGLPLLLKYLKLHRSEIVPARGALLLWPY